MNTQINFTNIKDTLKEINQKRLNNKDKWIFIQVTKGQDTILIKSYNTFIQIIRKNDINYQGGIDLKVVDWKKLIENCITSN
jgi:hypothetical protein